MTQRSSGRLTALVAVVVAVVSAAILSGAPDKQSALRAIDRTVIFSDNFADTTWCDYHRVQNSDYSDEACDYDNDSYALRPEDGAARFEVRPGDSPGGGLGSGERSELSQDATPWQAEEGDEWLLHERIRLNEGFSPGRWTVLTQFHAGSGSPPLALEVREDGALILRSSGEAGEANAKAGRPDRVLVPAEEFMDMRGEWFTVDLRVRWSNDVDEGGTEAYVNGELVAPWRAQQTMSSDRIYWKAGIYRAPTESRHVMWLDDVVISAPGSEAW